MRKPVRTKSVPNQTALLPSNRYVLLPSKQYMKFSFHKAVPQRARFQHLVQLCCHADWLQPASAWVLCKVITYHNKGIERCASNRDIALGFRIPQVHKIEDTVNIHKMSTASGVALIRMSYSYGSLSVTKSHFLLEKYW